MVLFLRKRSEVKDLVELKIWFLGLIRGFYFWPSFMRLGASISEQNLAFGFLAVEKYEDTPTSELFL